MKVLVLSLVIVFFHHNLMAAENILTCGQVTGVVDKTAIENCKKNQCGILISANKYLKPMLEVVLSFPLLKSDFYFLGGLSQLLKVSNENVKVKKIEMATGRLAYQFTTTAGSRQELVQFDVDLVGMSSDLNKAAYYQGYLTFTSNYGKTINNKNIQVEVAEIDNHVSQFGCIHQ